MGGRTSFSRELENNLENSRNDLDKSGTDLEKSAKNSKELKRPPGHTVSAPTAWGAWSQPREVCKRPRQVRGACTADLENSRNDLEKSRNDLEKSGNDLEKSRNHLEKSRNHLEKSRNRLEKSRNDLEASENCPGRRTC